MNNLEKYTEILRAKTIPSFLLLLLLFQSPQFLATFEDSVCTPAGKLKRPLPVHTALPTSEIKY